MTAGPVLRDIHLPAEPSWWPPAPGWWLLAVIVLALAFLAARRLARGQRLRAARRRLRREFDALRARHPSDHAAAEQVAALSLLLRRASKRHFPAAASLRDQHWLQFLDGDVPERPFSTGAGRLLLDGPFRAYIDPFEADALAALVRTRLDRMVGTDHA